MRLITGLLAAALLIVTPALAGKPSQFWFDQMAREHGTPQEPKPQFGPEPDGHGYEGVCQHTYCFDDGSEMSQAWLDYQNADYDPADYPDRDDQWRPYQPWYKGDYITHDICCI